MRDHISYFNKTQTGAALIICLMLLTITTLVALNAVSSTVLEEKMAGNIRNKHLSFQAAEAGLRAGELAASGLGQNPIYDGNNGLFPHSEPGDVDGVAGALATFPAWGTIAATEWVDGATIPYLEGPPQFIIEEFGEAVRDSSCGANMSEAPDDCFLTVNRITAQGVGLNSNSVTIIQSTYQSL